MDSVLHTNVISSVDIGADEFVDSDGDLMADAWETIHFGNLARNGFGDADGDTANDLEEYNLGFSIRMRMKHYWP